MSDIQFVILCIQLYFPSPEIWRVMAWRA